MAGVEPLDDDEEYDRVESMADEIVDRVYVGSWIAAANADFLRNCRITHVLSMTPDYPPPDEPESLVTKHIPIQDMEDADLGAVLEDGVDFIANSLSSSEQNRVLVHCNAGQSRSASVVLAFMVKHLDMPLRIADESATKRRDVIAPNCGFWKQLGDWEVKHRGGEPTIDLKEKKIERLCAILGSANEEQRAAARKALEENGWDLMAAFDPFFSNLRE